MQFAFTEEQLGLRDAVRRLAADQGETSGPEHRDLVWRTVTQQLGLTGIGIAESRGGAGGGAVEAAVVIEEVGRALLPVPLTSTLVAAIVLDRCVGGSDPVNGDVVDEVLSAVAAGTRVAALGVGEIPGVARHVLDGDVADVVVVAAADGLWCVDAKRVAVTPRPALDPSRGQADVAVDEGPAVRIAGAEVAAFAVDLMRVALAVEAVGAARRCLELTIAHLTSREQFGRPIGSFQALQHRAADLVVALESASSTAYYAAWTAAAAPAELPVAAPAAKALCTDAAWRVAAETIQMHGGIGFTWEHPAHRYLKRITTLRLVLGDGAEQRRLVAQRAGLTGPAPLPVSGPARAGS